MSTIREVAELAGVSVGTVSHVVNRSVTVSEPLRIRVEEAIRELDYHPNHVARSLKTSRTRTLGIIVPDMTITFFPQIIRGAEVAARERGYSLVAVNSMESVERQDELLSMLRSQRVEGILLVVAAVSMPKKQMAHLVNAGIPIVCLDRVPEGFSVDSVSIEDSAAAQLGVEHLLQNGYRRIAILTGPMSLRNERQRLRGYERALKRAGIPVVEELIWHGDLTPETAADLCSVGLNQLKPSPDAVFCTNGPTALGVLRALRNSGLTTPDDIGLVTFDELTVDDLFRPSLTTIVQPTYDIGYQASTLLLNRIEQGASLETLQTVKLKATLKARESSMTTGRKRPTRVAQG